MSYDSPSVDGTVHCVVRLSAAFIIAKILVFKLAKATKSYASFGDLKGATRKTLAFCSTDRPSAGRPAKIGMTALQPEGLVLTGGAANDTREQPCMQPQPHGVEPSQCKQQPEMDPLGLTKDAQQQVLLHLHPLAARGASC